MWAGRTREHTSNKSAGFSKTTRGSHPQHWAQRLSEPDASFIAKYIFPGGYLPALSEISAAIERSGLILADVEVLRTHYALTLEIWRHRFRANREQAVALHGERFCRCANSIWRARKRRAAIKASSSSSYS